EDPAEYEPEASKSAAGVWIAAVIVVAASAIAVYFFGMRRTPPPAAAPPQVEARPEAPPRPLGGNAEPISLPPLDESDRLVRELVGKLSSHPTVMAWLATEGIIRNFTVVVVNVADGNTPAGQLRSLRPVPSFRIRTQAGEISIDPRSY